MGFLTKIASILKRSGKDGQHTVEYVILIIIVMAGIITMNRYVIRSWNANLKGWEDSAIDSMEDPLLVAPAISMPAGECTASDWIEIGCGMSAVDACSGDDILCGPTEMTSIRAFSPSGCQCDPSNEFDNTTVQCTDTGCCCEAPVSTGLCGTNAPSGSAPPCDTTGLTPTTASGCPDGSMGYSTVCAGSTYYGCKEDANCQIYCPELAGPPNSLGSFPETLEGLPATLTCETGYIGVPTRECLAGGIWGDLQDECVEDPCFGDTPDPDCGVDGIVVSVPSTNYYTLCNYILAPSCAGTGAGIEGRSCTNPPAFRCERLHTAPDAGNNCHQHRCDYP